MKVSFLFFLIVFLYLCLPYPGFIGRAGLTFIEIIFVITPILISFILLLTKGLKIKEPKLVFCMLLIIYFQVFSVFSAAPESGILKNLLDVGKSVAFAFSLICGLKLGQYISDVNINQTLIFVFIISSLVALGQFVFGASLFMYLFSGREVGLIDEQFSFRIIGTIGNPSFFAIINIFFLFYFFGNYLINNKSKYFILGCISILFVFISQSRTNVAIMFLMILIFLITFKRCYWIHVKSKFVINVTLFLSISLCVPFVYLLIKYSILTYLVSGITTVYEKGLLSQNSFNTRFNIWNDYYQLIIRQPWFGYSSNKGFYQYAFADNNYIFILYKYGVIGLLLYLISLTYILSRLYKIVRSVGEPIVISLFFLGVVLMLSSLTAETIEGIRITPVFFMLSGIILSNDKYKVIRRK